MPAGGGGALRNAAERGASNEKPGAPGECEFGRRHWAPPALLAAVRVFSRPVNAGPLDGQSVGRKTGTPRSRPGSPGLPGPIGGCRKQAHSGTPQRATRICKYRVLIGCTFAAQNLMCFLWITFDCKVGRHAHAGQFI